MDPHQDPSITLHRFPFGLVKCVWHEASGIWNEKKGKPFFMRVGLASSLDASSGSHEVARTELNTLYTANDLRGPRITSLRTDEKQAVGELCQLTNFNYRARHGGCLAQVGVGGGVIQQTRLTEGLTVPFIGVCMKVGAAGFSDIFYRSYIPPTCSTFSNTRI
jgi:hypothetical protein